METDTGLLPHRPPVDEPDRETRVVDLDTAEAAELCGVLASETATDILAALSDEPMAASDVAERVDTSLQNAHHHLGRLRESELVRVVDTWYSSRGSEMKVYAPVNERLVLAAPTSGADPATEGREVPVAVR
ncbi:ArsR/SmtB family transcription factor [Salinirubellus sp. GCM10025818]|uniref:ArsR/SmtB family transcription factor n=1 Tax=Salinirubellus TaxID=2162630 RepID=UPI0030D6193F